MQTINKSRKIFVLIHSAWLGAWQWNEVKELLEKDGHEVICPDLKGHGNDITPANVISMNDYINDVIGCLDSFKGKCILVGHSFNGITITKAAELRSNKISALVYLTAFMVSNGVSFFRAVQGLQGSEVVDNFYISHDGSSAMVQSEKIHSAFAHDVSELPFDFVKPYLSPEPLLPLQYELNVDEKVLSEIPKFYIECTEDRAIPIEIQRAMYAGKVKKVFTMPSSHMPVFSDPKKLCGFLIDISNEVDFPTDLNSYT
jgi:pimeloyl-ACP methyl ester carboxylesterase